MMYDSLLLMGLCSCRPLSTSKYASELDHEAMEEVAWSDESRFLLHQADDCVCVNHLPGEEMAPGCAKAGWQSQCDALGKVLLGNLGSWHLCG